MIAALQDWAVLQSNIPKGFGKFMKDKDKPESSGKRCHRNGMYNGKCCSVFIILNRITYYPMVLVD